MVERKAGGETEQFIGLMRPRIPGSRSFQCSISSTENRARKKKKCAQALVLSLKNIFPRRPLGVSG